MFQIVIQIQSFWLLLFCYIMDMRGLWALLLMMDSHDVIYNFLRPFYFPSNMVTDVWKISLSVTYANQLCGWVPEMVFWTISKGNIQHVFCWHMVIAAFSQCYQIVGNYAIDTQLPGDVMPWKRFSYHWPFVRKTHRWLAGSPHIRAVMRTFDFFLLL